MSLNGMALTGMYWGDNMFKDFELLKGMTPAEFARKMDEAYNPAEDFEDYVKDQKFTSRITNIEITEDKLIAHAKCATGLIFQYEVTLADFDDYESAAEAATSRAIAGIEAYERGEV